MEVAVEPESPPTQTPSSLGGQDSLGGSTSSAGSRAQLTGLVAADGSASAEGAEDEKAGAKKEVVTIFASTE